MNSIEDCEPDGLSLSKSTAATSDDVAALDCEIERIWRW